MNTVPRWLQASPVPSANRSNTASAQGRHGKDTRLGTPPPAGAALAPALFRSPRASPASPGALRPGTQTQLRSPTVGGRSPPPRVRRNPESPQEALTPRQGAGRLCRLQPEGEATAWGCGMTGFPFPLCGVGFGVLPVSASSRFISVSLSQSTRVAGTSLRRGVTGPDCHRWLGLTRHTSG